MDGKLPARLVPPGPRCGDRALSGPVRVPDQDRPHRTRASRSIPVYGGRLRPLSGAARRLGQVTAGPKAGRNVYSAAAAGAAEVAEATSTVTPGPMVELSEIFFR